MGYICSMDKTNRYMSEIFRIVSGALRLDANKVRNYAEFLAEKLECDGDLPSAKRLRKLLSENDHQLHPAQLSSTALPIDSETRFPLLEKVDLNNYNSELPLILSQQQTDLLKEFVCVAKSQAQFESLGIDTPLTLLLYGPPGCGKSRFAREVATLLCLPIYIARLDGLISSFLGSTSKNIRAIFEFVASRPCVLFLDEFDAIAKMRDDAQELGELKRVVNSFLQNLDSIGNETIVIAATNHEQLLDSAVWRRFNYRVELLHPNIESRKFMWAKFLQPIDWSDHDIEVLTDLSDGFTGSDIREVCLQLNRYQVIRKEGATLNDVFVCLRRLTHGNDSPRCYLTKVNIDDNQEVINFFQKRNKKLYSHSVLAALLNVSKTTSHRWAKQSKVKNGKG